MLSVRKEVERCKVGVGDESGPCPTVQCYRVYLLILWLWQPVHTAVSPFHSTDAVILYITQSQQQVGTMAYLCRIILLLLTIIVTRAGKEDFDKNV